MFLTQIIAEDIAFDDLAEYIKSSCSNFINKNNSVMIYIFPFEPNILDKHMIEFDYTILMLIFFVL